LILSMAYKIDAFRLLKGKKAGKGKNEDERK
jgi:hypothetical protein